MKKRLEGLKMDDEIKFVLTYKKVFSEPGQVIYVKNGSEYTLKLSDAAVFDTHEMTKVVRKITGYENSCHITSVTTKELFQARLKGI